MKLSALLMSILLLLALVIALEPQQSLPRAEAAILTVTNLNDSGTGSLRQAILDANGAGGADVINFSVTGMITLSSQLDVTDDLTINGSGITLDGNNTTRILVISSATVTLNDLNLKNGQSDFGSAILNDGGAVAISASTVSGNMSVFGGDAIYSDGGGLITITNSTFTGNKDSVGLMIYTDGPLTITDSSFEGGTIWSYGDDSLTISNSTFTGNADSGPSAISTDGTLTITDSTFSDNIDAGDGVIRSNDGTLVISNSTFSNNTGSDVGAIGSYGGTLEISNSTFSGNTATNGSGGAISTDGSGTLTITGSTFSGNTASSSSGGAISNGGALTITNSTFSGNTAYEGGAIVNSGPMEITGSTFSNNTATRDGGAIYNYYNSLTITDSTFSGNTATLGDGGAIRNVGPMTITNSTFNSNTAYEGGAIYNYRTLTITSSTFRSNTATSGSGGAIYDRTRFAHLFIFSSTFSGNTASLDGGTIYRDEGTVDVDSSIIVGGECDGGFITDQGNNISFNAPGCPGIVANPLLGPLQNNGGPTKTMLPALNGPAVDAYAAPCATATDQRGVTRPQGTLCDIGATEQEGLPPTDTPIPPTDTPIPPTDTPQPPTDTPVPPTDTPIPPTDTPVPPTDTPGPITLVVSATCVDENLDVTISAGDGSFNITASAGINTPVNGVNVGTTTINGPEKWDNLIVTETSGDEQSTNLGTFKCRTDERPVPVSPAHQSRTTNPFPTFSWTAISIANNYRIFVFDSASAATRTVDIRQNSGGPTTLVLTTPLPDGRLFWRVRGRQNRVWSLWSVRFTLFKDPVVPFSVSTPVPTIDLNPPSGADSVPSPVPTIGPAPTFPAPPNSR